MMVAEHLLDQSIGPWIRGELTPRPQPSDGATVTRPIRREDGRLDPTRSAVELERQVRAFQPWPGSFVDTTFGRIAVWSASPRVSGEPANGVFDERGLGVGDGERLWLSEVQPAGGKRMPWEAFLRGHPGIVGTRALASDS
jgi:methionyl-tRNA formyltransferase